MIENVLLVRPYSEGKKELPINLLYLGTSLKNKGFKVDIIDLQDDREGEREIANILKKLPNSILGITSLAANYYWVKNFSLKIKSELPNLPIVIGGHIAISYELLLSNTGVDYVCLGEGEEALPELINCLNQKLPLDNIRGMAYKENNKIVKTTWRKLITNFLIPDYSLINTEKYFIHPSQDAFFKRSIKYQERSKPDDRMAVIMFSRGCIGACGFCYRHLPGFRQGSIDWSWDHLMLLYNKYSIKYFRIDDELFTNNIQWLESLSEKIKEAKLDILFRVTGLRVDTVNPELLTLLKDMGCIAVNYGIESGSQFILDKMNKRVKVEDNLKAIQTTLSLGMQVMAYIMLGYEGENGKTLRETTEMLFESGLGPDSVSIFYAQAMPGTKLYQNSLEKKWITNEDKYLEGLFALVQKQKEPHEYYTINFSETSVKNLIKYEYGIILLLKLKKELNLPKFIILIKSIFFVLPPNIFIAINNFFCYLSKLNKKARTILKICLMYL